MPWFNIQTISQLPKCLLDLHFSTHFPIIPFPPSKNDACSHFPKSLLIFPGTFFRDQQISPGTFNFSPGSTFPISKSEKFCRHFALILRKQAGFIFLYFLEIHVWSLLRLPDQYCSTETGRLELRQNIFNTHPPFFPQDSLT